MVANPMQRKSRTSFILGLILGLFITGVLSGFLFYQLKLMKDAENERISKEKQVYVLKSDVKSGDSLTSDLLNKVTIASEGIPTDAITPSSLDENTIAKIDLKKGTVITTSSIQESDEKTTDDLRIQEYNMLKISTQLKTGDYIDIRLRMPSGLDYLVISKKKVEVPIVGDTDSENTIWLKMTEDETLTMSEAIVETYMMEGAILYTANYVEPGLQATATPTYIPNESVINLISRNPNVVNDAKTAIYKRYQEDSIGTRNKISSEVAANADKAEDNVKSKTTTEVTTTQTQRKAYLDALAGN